VQIKGPLKDAVRSKFGADIPLVDRILELETGVKSIAIGTLYKEMKVRSSEGSGCDVGVALRTGIVSSMFDCVCGYACNFS
jgi:hypothetical protein